MVKMSRWKVEGHTMQKVAELNSRRELESKVMAFLSRNTGEMWRRFSTMWGGNLQNVRETQTLNLRYFCDDHTRREFFFACIHVRHTHTHKEGLDMDILKVLREIINK